MHSSNKKILSSTSNSAILQKRIYELEKEKEKLRRENRVMKEKILDKYLKNETINNEDDLINHIEAVLEEVAVVIDFLEKQEDTTHQPKSSAKKDKLKRVKGTLNKVSKVAKFENKELKEKLERAKDENDEEEDAEGKVYLISKRLQDDEVSP